MFSLCFLPKPIKAPVNSPEDILSAEIFTRLPLESLARCLAVCKLWSSLINNSNIIRSKLNYCISQNLRDDFLIVCYSKSRFSHVLCLLSRTNLSETLIDQVPWHMFNCFGMHLVGSINGLVCTVALYFDSHFILWNPAIHVSMKVPLPYKNGSRGYLIGFGWDCVTNDYKLVVKHKFHPRFNRVYSCKTKRWTYNTQVLSVQFPSLTSECWAPDVIVKGAPYWSSGTIIFKFEARYNNFTCLRVFPARQCYRLVNMSDCLARIDYGPGEATDVDVYGYDEEHRFWNKMHTINISKTCTFSHITCFKYDAEIVFFDENKMYFPRLNEIKVLGRCHDQRTFGICHDERIHATCSFSYTPSLVSVKGMKSLRCRDSHRSLAGITSRSAFLGVRLLLQRVVMCIWKEFWEQILCL